MTCCSKPRKTGSFLKKATRAKLDDDSFKEEAQEERDRLLQEFKNSLPKSYSVYFAQCETPFKNDVNKLIAETKAEVEKYLESLEQPWWKTALVLGALVVGGAGLAIGAVAAAPAALGALAAVDAAVAAAGIGNGLAAGVGAGAGAGLGLGYGFRNAVWNYQLKNENNCIEVDNKKGEELALTKYEDSSIYVMLCFGTIEIKLRSRKVKL